MTEPTPRAGEDGETEGETEVSAALADLEKLSDRPLSEHADRLAVAQEALQRILDDDRGDGETRR